MRNNTLSLLNFINFTLWQEAKKLLDFQINQMDKNKHYLTLSMFYYKRISHLTSIVNTQEYFDKRVANALFYALEREFAFYDYVVPKSYLGLRNQKFITYPLRVLYYSIGLYLLKLSQDFLQTYAAKNKRLKCYYGGNLLFNQNSLTVKHETTFYKSYYKDFKKQIRKQITNDSDNKLVIKLDIENFFDNISIPTLLDNLDRSVKPSIKEELNFTTSTKENLKFFYSYLSHNQGGIPQADNDIISSFIGYLYLTFSDLLIDSEILTYKEFINEHTIIRYVDDIFIVVNFCNEAAQLQIQCV